MQTKLSREAQLEEFIRAILLQNLGTVSKLAANKNFKVKLHGAFMIGAWVFFASIGMFLARYFKQTWTGSKCCKLDQWFIWHRFFMVTTWGLTVAGVILIFLELQVTAIRIRFVLVRDS